MPEHRPVLRDAVLGAATFAALTLPDPERMSPRGRHLLRLGSASAAGWLGSRAARAEGMPFAPPGLLGAAAGAALALACAPLEEAADRRLAGWLRGRGAKDPRTLMALGAAGLGALAVALDTRALVTQAEGGGVEVDDLYHERPLDPALREVVAAVLAAGPAPAREVLLAQLEGARAQALGEDFESTVMLVVDEDAARAVPHSQTWPVRARWHIDGHPVELTVQVHEGRVDHVALMPVEEDYPSDVDPYEVTPVDDPGNTWPGAAGVVLVEETAEGVRPVAAGQPS